ncbi:MAG: PD-(D/E)XK nuclease domain-containing protein, partial [Succinivibrio sp.]
SVPIELFLNPTSLLDIDQNVLMCQTGYLTLKRPLTNTSTAVLGIPNFEVQKSLARLLKSKIFDSSVNTLARGAKELFTEGNTEKIIEKFNCILNCIRYDNYPLINESALTNYLNIFLVAVGIPTSLESYSSKGRADMVIDLGRLRMSFEFKYAHNETEAKVKLTEAVEQIQSRDYGNTLPQKELLRIAAVFNSDPKVRSIMEYQSEIMIFCKK